MIDLETEEKIEQSEMEEKKPKKNVEELNAVVADTVRRSTYSK